MAFDSIWKNLGGTQAFNAAANWEGDVPVDAESALISAGDAQITTGMDQSLLDLAQLSIGCGFEGSIGTPDDPLTLGDTTLLRVRAPSSKTLHLRIAEDKTCAKLTIHGTSNRPYACSIASGGSGSTLGLWDEVHVVSGLLHVTSSAKIDDLYVAPGGIVIIEHGATIDNIHNYGGRVTNNTAIGTKLYQHNGTFIHQGTTAGGVNVGTMEIHGGDLLLNCKGAVITLLDVRGGFVDNWNCDHENTITNMNVWYGARARMSDAVIHTSDPVVYGDGSYSGPGTPQVAVPAMPVP